MIYGIWNFGPYLTPTAHARNLVTICAATRLTGVFDEPVTPPATNTMNNTTPVQPAYSQAPPPFGNGKSTMIQLWEMALADNQQQQ